MQPEMDRSEGCRSTTSPPKSQPIQPNAVQSVSLQQLASALVDPNERPMLSRWPKKPLHEVAVHCCLRVELEHAGACMNRELKGFLASKHELTTKVQDPPLEKPGLMHHNCHGSCSITVVLKASLIPATCAVLGATSAATRPCFASTTQGTAACPPSCGSRCFHPEGSPSCTWRDSRPTTPSPSAYRC